MKTLHLTLALALSFPLISACSKPEAQLQPVSAQAQAGVDDSRSIETNCPPENYADVSTLGAEQLDPLFKIAEFSLDGDLTREEFESNPRYVEISLFGAEFLSTTDVAIRGIVSATSTPPLSLPNAAKLARKLAKLKTGDQYARAGAMGSVQAKTKTCFLMVKNGLP